MTNTEKNIYQELKRYKKVCFGPILSDFGWEVSYIAGFIKKYKKDNPDKTVFVATRENRKELYENSGLDEIFTFKIDGDYATVTPRTHSVYKVDVNNVNVPIPIKVEDEFKYVKDKISNKHPHTKFYSFTKFNFTIRPEFSIHEFDYSFKTHDDNSKLIENIINNNPNRKIVTIFSRQRVDLDHRNLGVEKWNHLLRRLSDLDSHVFLIAGVSPAYVKAHSFYRNMHNLEDMCGDNPNVTILGLMIEAIRRSDFTFGPQTAGILLSMAMQVPTLYFGTDYNLVSINYNPFKSQSDFIQVKVKHPSGEYDISPDELYKRITEIKLRDPNQIIVTPGPHTLDIEYRIPELHPLLAGLTGAQKIRKIRELNRNPSKSIPLIEPVPVVDTVITK